MILCKNGKELLMYSTDEQERETPIFALRSQTHRQTKRERARLVWLRHKYFYEFSSVNSISKDFLFLWFHDLCGRWYYSLLILCWPVAKLQKSFGGDEEDFSDLLDSKKYISQIPFYEILWFCNMCMSDSVHHICVWFHDLCGS